MANNSFLENQALSATKLMLGNAAGYKLFFNERDSDVSIKVLYEDEEWKFPAHKLVLCTMSDVFRKMLEVDMIEKSTNTITIKDSDPHAIKQFLRYVYMGLVEFIDWHEAVSILKVAHKYNVHTLINLCEGFLISNIFFSNVCYLYELARIYSLDLLKKLSQDFILESGFIVSATNGFFKLRSSSLQYFLSSPLFNVEDEGSLLTCLREWAVNDCARRCVSLANSNVLGAMEPFLKYIRWNLIPECERTFVPTSLVEKNKNPNLVYRRHLHIPTSLILQHQINALKCSVELGAFHQEDFFAQGSLPCLKFSVDNHIFFAGFKIIGLFHKYAGNSSAPNFLILKGEDGKAFIQLNLMSLPWMRGASVGCHVWQELTAYLPYPVRVDPFNTYMLALRSTRSVRADRCVKWPITRLDTEPLSTNLGTIAFNSHGPSYGITQLFVFPAPPYRKVCNLNTEDY